MDVMLDRHRRAALPAVLTVVLLLVPAVVAALPAAAGARARPDTAFGGGQGFVTAPIPNAAGTAYGVLVLKGGGIVVAGQSATPTGSSQIVVARLRSDGSLNPTFGNGGIFTTTLPASDGPFIANAIAMQSRTRSFLIAGGYGQDSMLALRLTANGRRDRSFGGQGTGLSITPAGGAAQSIAVAQDGRFLLGGSNANLNGRPMVVARFGRNGVLDRSFAGDGIAQPLFWDADLAVSSGVASLALTSDGGVAGAGHIDYIGGGGGGGGGHGSAGIFRLSSTGAPVADFGTAGHREIAFRPGGDGRTFAQWFPSAMRLDGRGRITVTGDGSTQAGTGVLSTRLTAAGRLDASFGTGGRSFLASPSADDGDTTGGATLIAPGNLTVGVGSRLAQLRQDGTPNTAFAPGGLVTIGRPPQVELNAVARWGQDRVVITGGAGNDLYVARYRLD